MAQPPAADRPRPRPRMAPLARLASHGQDHSKRDRVPDPHQPAATRIPSNPPRGPSPHPAPALSGPLISNGLLAVAFWVEGLLKKFEFARPLQRTIREVA